jgi:hypothetical protein
LFCCRGGGTFADLSETTSSFNAFELQLAALLLLVTQKTALFNATIFLVMVG